MVISANPSTMTNLTYCFVAKNVEKIADQQLEDSEELSANLLSLEEMKELLETNQIKQALMALPLWKFMRQFCK